jgi:hypothetical protein
MFICAFAANEEPKTKNQEQVTVPFRPEAGKFPALKNAHSYRGELVFVDHANRRGSLRIQGVGSFRRNEPHPFALLPYGMVRYHGAPADLRDIPLGTMMHVLAYLPPDPKNSAVPVLPINNKENTAGFRDRGTAPAENHILLLEDEPSYDLRTGKAWKLGEVVLQNHAGLMVATREPTQGSPGQATDETMTIDASTRVWRGRECLGIEDLIAEGTWPAEGKKSLSPQVVQLGLTWKPTAGSVFNRFHIADIWIDDAAMQRATQHQTKAYEAFIRSRWMPAWIDAVEYGKFGRATVTATLFGGMPPALYADFKKGMEKHRWAAAVSRFALRRTSSPKASGPRASCDCVPRTGPTSMCHAKNISTAGPPAWMSASPLRPFSQNTNPPGPPTACREG